MLSLWCAPVGESSGSGSGGGSTHTDTTHDDAAARFNLRPPQAQPRRGPGRGVRARCWIPAGGRRAAAATRSISSPSSRAPRAAAIRSHKPDSREDACSMVLFL
eukprot:COSAG01_NODE_903_length_12848_cov_7.966899_2_plen_104_part_00